LEKEILRLSKNKNKTTLTYKENVKQAVDSAQEIELEVSDIGNAWSF